jgi:chromosome segregation ATPase
MVQNSVADVIVQTKFNPALDQLIGVVSEKFSNAFEKVGCSGEVKIERYDNRYDQWGIKILVSYRDGDDMQGLTGTLQSGGVSGLGEGGWGNADGIFQERALATVTYFMSLSEMARTPFSLVDEINQVS